MAPNGHKNLHQGLYIKKLAIRVALNVIIGINKTSISGFLKALRPKKGLINCNKATPHINDKRTIAIKKIPRIIFVVLRDISKLYLDFFCSFKLDLKFSFEASSCKAPTGQAVLQNNRPTIKVDRSSKINIIMIGIIELIGRPNPKVIKICWIGIIAFGMAPKIIPPKTKEIK